MSTITTKQLRENMAQVINDLQKGKSIQLSYRHKVIGVLQPAQFAGLPLRRGTPEAIIQGLDLLRNVHVPERASSDPRSMKEQLAELRNRRYAK